MPATRTAPPCRPECPLANPDSRPAKLIARLHKLEADYARLAPLDSRNAVPTPPPTRQAIGVNKRVTELEAEVARYATANRQLLDQLVTAQSLAAIRTAALARADAADRRSTRLERELREERRLLSLERTAHRNTVAVLDTKLIKYNLRVRKVAKAHLDLSLQNATLHRRLNQIAALAQTTPPPIELIDSDSTLSDAPDT
jgi:hypothetical protein